MNYLEEKAVLQSFFLKAPPKTWIAAKDASPIMVLSSGKCGTTTLNYLLNCSQSIMAYHELGPRLWHLGDKVFQQKGLGSLWEIIYWAARRDIISTLEENEFRFVENNNRASVFAPAVLRLMPKTKYIVLWRDFDESVISMCRWGIYTPYDRTREGRLEPPPEITDIRNKVAWYWVTFYQWVLDFTKELDDVIFVPFSLIKNKDIEAIQAIFARLNARVPDSDAIQSVLNEKYNAARHKQEVPKVWHDFDSQAKQITKRLMAAGSP